MAVITGSQLSLAFGDQVILQGVDIAIQDGERVGLVGKNGGGKSTLARIVASAMVPDDGTITVRSGAAVAYLPQQPQFKEGLTARDIVTSGLQEWAKANASYEEVCAKLAAGDGVTDSLLNKQAELAAEVERLGGWDQQHRVERVTSNLGVTRLDDPVTKMSGGERRRVDLARVLISQPALAILDEPTNHLDVATIEWLEEFLVNDFSGALLLITHDRYVLNHVVTRTLELSRGSLFSYAGGWESYLTSKAERAAHEARAESNRQNILRRELDWLRRSPKARTTKSKSRIKRAESLIASGPAEAEREIEALAMQRARSGKTACELTDLSVTAYGKKLICNLDLVVRDGERVGILGKNGAGKTSLLKVLLGELESTGGELRIAKNTKFAYFDQERTRLDDELSIRENVCDNREQLEIGGQQMSVSAYLSRFLFDGHKQRQPVSSLSGGERARVQLAKFLLEPANVLLLDEPTNDLDVATLSALEEFLLDSGVTAIFVTHDRYFLDRVADSVLAFEGDGRVVRYEGSAQALEAARAASSKAEATSTAKHGAAPSQASGKKTSSKKQKSGLTFTEKHELEGLMPLVEEAEVEVEALEKELADPELYSQRGAEVKPLQEKLVAAQQLVETRIARWEELEAKREAGE